MSVVDATSTPASDSRVIDEGSAASGSTAFGRHKLDSDHFERLAVVYVRQSDPQQVLRHRESTDLQYHLVDLAAELGWSRERIVVIDEDLGTTGRHAEGREGFQRMMAEVAMNHVGIILGREMSRLARSCKDWYQLLEVCGLFGTMLADQDGVYDPSQYHDRLLLGLTGIMSEAELHVMRGRLYAGLMNKARRGELFTHLPIGYVFQSPGEVVLDLDEQVRSTVRLVFEKFDEIGSISGLLRYLAQHDIRLGIRPHKGPHRGQLEWRRPSQATLRNMLHHPLYAGAYSYGRRKVDPRRKVPGKPATGRTNVPRDQWAVLLKDRHPAYISWEQFEANQLRLEDNRNRSGNLGAPREGKALLGGLLVCGKCGGRMIVNYGSPRAKLKYLCQRQRDCYGLDRCQSVVGHVLDDLVTRQAFRVLEPAALELSLTAATDIQCERQRLAEHWTQRRERARYEAERAARQYHAVEPENRLVARRLEHDWEQALLQQRIVEDEYERFLREKPTALTEADRRQIESLATTIPGLWNAATTTNAQRQVILRHLIDHIVVEVQGQTEFVDVAIHWAGGFISRHEIVRPVKHYHQLRDYDRLTARIHELKQTGLNSRRIAEHLNREGFRPPRRAKQYSAGIVRQLVSRGPGRKSVARHRHRTSSLRLDQDEWFLGDLAVELSIPETTLYNWLRRGWLHARKAAVDGASRVIAWADADERDRLRRLHAFPLGHNKARGAPKLTTPKQRP
jgi:DNA invertase Pin-like site-specific DNA recombinase